MYRQLLQRLGNRRIAKRIEQTSSLHAISQLVPQSTLERVANECADRRGFFRHLAKTLGVTEERLSAEVAGVLELPLLRRLAGAPERAVDFGFEIGALEAVGAIPVEPKDRPAGIACVDPSAVVKLSFGKEPPLYLASWSVIEAAYLAISEHFLGDAQKTGDTSLAAKAFRYIVGEVDAYGSHSFTIEFNQPSLSYHFRTAEGKSGSGNISSKLKDELRSFLVALSRKTTYAFESKGASLFAHVSVTDNANSVMVAWSANFQECPLVARPEAVKQSIELSATDVLLVDDNSAFCEILQRFLKLEGIRAVQLSSGQEAVALLLNATTLPAALVCDLRMPGLTGGEVVKLLRASPQLKTFPVIILTSEEGTEIELEALKVGADHFISKGADPRILVAHLSRLIHRAQPTVEAA